MKLVVQIPCFNEEGSLKDVIENIPRQIPGIDKVEILVINDGSKDATHQVAEKAGANYIVSFKKNRGLAAAFSTGLDKALELGADIIVNTDGDHQYIGSEIPTLIKPILDGHAEIVIGDRSPATLSHLSWTRKMLHKLGNWMVRQVAGIYIPDATSGFRAFSREAALRLNIVSKFSYTIESIIAAAKKGIAIAHVPIRTNETKRKSRLYRSLPQFLKRSFGTIIRIYVMYEPLKTFCWIGGLVALPGVFLVLRFLGYYFFASGAGKIQSLIIAGILIIIGFLIIILGIVSDLISFNRIMIEDVLYKIKKDTKILTGKELSSKEVKIFQ